MVNVANDTHRYDNASHMLEGLRTSTGDRDLNSGVLIAISSNYGADTLYLLSAVTQVSLVSNRLVHR